MLAKGKKGIRLIGYFGLVLCFSAISVMDSYAQKKEYPERTIKLLVGTVPGGVSDLWTRAWIDEFSKILKVPVVIENIGGASTTAALIEAATAKPDGYILNNVSQSAVAGFAIASKPPYDLFKDFVPIGALGSFPTLVVVEKSSPFKTHEELDRKSTRL